MPIEPMYFAVFFIDGKPANYLNSEYKRINQVMFNNLADGMAGKTVTLKENKEKLYDVFEVLSVESFGIKNSVDNHLFVICHIKKITTT